MNDSNEVVSRKKELENRKAKVKRELTELSIWHVSKGVRYKFSDYFRELVENSELEFHKEAKEKNRRFHELEAELGSLEEELDKEYLKEWENGKA